LKHTEDEPTALNARNTINISALTDKAQQMLPINEIKKDII
jgi:hypothetical protein